MAFVLPARHPRLAHFMPYWKGDSLLAIVLAIRMRYYGIDQNLQVDANGVAWVVHWGRNWGRKSQKYTNGLGYITRLNPDGTTMRDRKGRELAYLDPKRFTPIQQRKTAEVDRLRSAPVGGRRLYKAVGHIQWLGRQQKHYKRKLVLMFEAKGVPSEATFRLLAQTAYANGVLLGVMRLQDLPGWRECLRNAHAAGIPIALLARGRKPADWAVYARMGCRVWGRWR